MGEGVIVAIIAGISAVLGAYISNAATLRRKSREDSIKEALREQKIMNRLDRLEKKVDEHNEYGRKFGEISLSIQGIQKDIEWIKGKEI